MSENETRCLVLGGRGFIGSHLVDALLAKGYRVRCFDQSLVSLDDTHTLNPCLELYEGDFISEEDVAEALVGCDVCFHLISTTLPKSSNADPVFDVESNLIGTLRLLMHAVKAGVKKVVFVSSGGTVYGVPKHTPILESHPTNPTCSYGITKLSIEKYLALFNELHGLDYTVLRIANPFGERQRTLASQGAVAVFLGKALRGEPIEIWGDGSTVRDYIYISDVIDALLATLNYSGNERVFNIGSGLGRSINEVLDAVESLTGITLVRRYMQSRLFDVPESVLCIERSRQFLGWFPKVKFEDGLARFSAWLKRNPDVL